MAKDVRSRFIELMYIVLYALVVQNGEEEVKIDYSKRLSEINDLKKNIEISCEDLSNIAKDIDDKVRAFDNNDLLRDKVNDTLEFYNIWKAYHDNNISEIDKLILSGGGYDDNNNIKFPGDKESVANFMKDNRLNNIKDYVRKISVKLSEYDFVKDNDLFKKIIAGLEDFGVFKKKLDDGSFVESSDDNFKDDELIQLVYYLYSEDFVISSYVKSVIYKLINNLQLENPIFDSFELIVIPKKESVVAGKNFEAKVFLNAKDYVKIPGEEPVITVNGSRINVSDYVGNIVFPTRRDFSFDENGNCKIQLKIEYSQRNPFSDQDIVLEKNIVFNVVNKSDIEGTLKVTDLFYKQCVNKFIIKNGDPELNNNLSYRIDGGRIISANDKGKNEVELSIYPTDDDCKLYVFNDGIELSSFSFKTIETPMPVFDILINGRVVPDQSELSSDDIQDISIDVINDENFELNYPLDCSNVVKDWVIEFKDNNRKTFDTITVTNTNTYEFDDNSRRILDSARCYYVYIRVNNVVRQHRDNEAGSNLEEVPLIKSYEVLAKQVKVLHKKKLTSR